MLRLAYKPTKLPQKRKSTYGYGWQISKYNGGRKIIASHAGSWVGFRTQFTRYIDDKFTMVALSNNSQAEDFLDDMVDEIDALFDD